MMDWIMHYWIQWAFGIMGSVFTTLFLLLGRKVKKTYMVQRATGNGVKALLRDRIIQAYNHYLDKGYCPIYGLDNVHEMYKEYSAMGGNGTISRLVDELRAMPRELKKEK